MKEGYVFKDHGEDLKVTRESMICLKAELNIGIYLLKGEVSMPVVAVADVDCESKL